MGARSMKRYDTLDELVVALCKDFLRRERLISNPATSHRTKGIRKGFLKLHWKGRRENVSFLSLLV